MGPAKRKYDHDAGPRTPEGPARQPGTIDASATPDLRGGTGAKAAAPPPQCRPSVHAWGDDAATLSADRLLAVQLEALTGGVPVRARRAAIPNGPWFAWSRRDGEAAGSNNSNSDGDSDGDGNSDGDADANADADSSNNSSSGASSYGSNDANTNGDGAEKSRNRDNNSKGLGELEGGGSRACSAPLP
ncbi:hypothetical protein CSUB01_11048 [Colletotrichum sublineola]|uniref:Uncharacterized protein n=1 Tax=Colletotrichum sublineola TaxID=1173701 RepID=A0A066XWC3_COLSU|nr:hypothetical protein CSUB01_11048 [Colletotrichum sublineola]